MNGRQEAPSWPIIGALTVVTAIAFVAQLQRGHPLHWDEVEYFRATRWTSLGAVPFRDFWEHHTPLQWIVFAPFARLFGAGSGAGAVVAMRWAQLPCWIVVAMMLLCAMRAEGLGGNARWSAIVLLFSAPAFVFAALAYRVDTLGNALFFAALLLVARGEPSRGRWIVYGALMSLAVLANLRLAPLVGFAGLLALLAADGRWRFRSNALWMIAGIAAVLGVSAATLEATGARAAFLDGVFHYNSVSQHLISTESSVGFFLMELVRDADVAAIALWIAGLAGAALALRDLARPRLPQLAALLAIASTIGIAAATVEYPYHFETTYVLLAFLAAIAFERLPRFAPLAIAALGALLALVPLVRAGFGDELAQQDALMRAVDRHTRPDDRVWDGVGFALRRRPAYRYWFLPLGVRELVRRGYLEPYDAPQLLAAPPAAIVGSVRIADWLEAFPALARVVVHNYLPVRQDLLLPAPSGIVDAAQPARWTALANGRYRLVASELLLRHPWFRNPIGYMKTRGPRAIDFEVPVAEVPRSAAAVTLSINGSVVNGEAIELHRGDIIELRAGTPTKTAVMLVPEGEPALFVASADR